MDLISKLADAIVELNNAHPRSPTKEEIAELLRDLVMRWDTVNQVMRSTSDGDINVHRLSEAAFADPKSSLSRLRLDGHPEADKAAAETYTYMGAPVVPDRAFISD